MVLKELLYNYLSEISFIRRKGPEAVIKLCWESLKKGQSLAPEAA